MLLAIHPFQDGNGRLSRALTALLLLQAGYAYVMYSSLERVIEQSKEQYYLALRQTQGTLQTSQPDWAPWLVFFLKAMQQQKERLRLKAEREKLLLTQLPELSRQILDLVQDHGRLSMRDAVTLTGASRNTLKSHFKRLQDRGLLKLYGQSRGSWYGLS